MNEQKKAEKRRNIPIILVCVVFGLLFFGVVTYGIVRVLTVLFTFGSDYEDGNGADNYSLEYLSEKDLDSDEDSQMFMSNVAYEGNATNVGGMLADNDRDSWYLQAQMFDGIRTVQATKIHADELTLKINSEVLSGNFEIFVLVDDMLYERIEANCEKELHLQGIQNKTILVKIAGEGADFYFEVVRTY